jgi:hypothetical protein
MAGRFPKPAHQNWRRPYLEDQGYGAVRQGGYGAVQQGFLDPYNPAVQEERMARRFPQPANQNWRNPYFEDRGYGDVQQGGYGGDQQGEKQLAIISELVPMKIDSIPLQLVHEFSESKEQIKKPLVLEAYSDVGTQSPIETGRSLCGVHVVAKAGNPMKPNDETEIVSDSVAVAVSLEEEMDDGSDPKPSAALLQLPLERAWSGTFGCSVFEGDFVPLWGFTSMWGRRPEMEDAVAAVPHFLKIPVEMLFGNRVVKVKPFNYEAARKEEIVRHRWCFDPGASHQAANATGWEVGIEAKRQQFVLQTAGDKNKDVIREKVDFLGGSVPGQHGSKNWQQGCLDAYNPVAQEERMDERFPQPAHRKWRRPYTADQGSGNDQQGNEQLAILTRSCSYTRSSMTVSCHLSEGLEDLDKSTSKALAISCSGSSDKRNGLVGRSSHYSPIEKRKPVGQTFCSVGVCTYGEAVIGSNSHIREEKVGLLLLNLGGPETLDDVQPFLFNLFADPDIIRLPRLFKFLQRPLAKLISVFRAPKSKEGYAAIGGGSPLRKITDEQANALKMALEAKNTPVNVYVGMRYWYPFTEEAFDTL